MLHMAVPAHLALEVSKDSNAVRSPFEYSPNQAIARAIRYMVIGSMIAVLGAAFAA